MVQYLKWNASGDLVATMLGSELDRIGGGGRTGRCALELTHRDAKEESRHFFTRLEEQPCGAVVNFLFLEASGIARNYEMTILPVLEPGLRNRLLAFVEPGESELFDLPGLKDLLESGPRILRHGVSGFLDIGKGLPPLEDLFKGLKRMTLDQVAAVSANPDVRKVPELRATF